MHVLRISVRYCVAVSCGLFDGITLNWSNKWYSRKITKFIVTELILRCLPKKWTTYTQ